jgi:hypothetical protein
MVTTAKLVQLVWAAAKAPPSKLKSYFKDGFAEEFVGWRYLVSNNLIPVSHYGHQLRMWTYEGSQSQVYEIANALNYRVFIKAFLSTSYNNTVLMSTCPVLWRNLIGSDGGAI